MVDEAKKNGVLAMVTEIVSAHLSNNTVPVADIPRLIHEVYGGPDRPRPGTGQERGAGRNRRSR